MSSSDDGNPRWLEPSTFEFTIDTSIPVHVMGETIGDTWTDTNMAWGLSHTATISHNSWLLTLDNKHASLHHNVIFLECLDGTYVRINNEHLLNDMDIFILKSIVRANKSSKKVKNIIDKLLIYK